MVSNKTQDNVSPILYVPMVAVQSRGKSLVITTRESTAQQVAIDPEQYQSLLALGNIGKPPWYIETSTDLQDVEEMTTFEGRLVFVEESFAKQRFELDIRRIQ